MDWFERLSGFRETAYRSAQTDGRMGQLLRAQKIPQSGALSSPTSHPAVADFMESPAMTSFSELHLGYVSGLHRRRLAEGEKPESNILCVSGSGSALA